MGTALKDEGQEMNGEPQKWKTASTRSVRRLPNWAFGIVLWLLWIGAPFSLLMGLWVGVLRIINIGDASHGFSDCFVVLAFGIAGMIIGTGVLAIAAFGGCAFLFLLRRSVRCLLCAVLYSCRREPSGDSEV